MVVSSVSNRTLSDVGAGIVCCFFIATLIFGLWCYIHRFCILILYIKLHAHTTSIALLVVTTVLLSWCMCIWLQVWWQGPLYQPRIPTFKIIDDPSDHYSIPPPRWYPCDPHGYPLWCSACGSVKYFRSHHSHVEGKCVVRMDHYCQWLHCTIGAGNYRYFIQFTVYFHLFCVFVMVTILCYVRHLRAHPEVVVLLVIAGLGVVFTGTLFLEHAYFISRNVTSLEYMQLKADRRGGSTAAKRQYYIAYQPDTPQEEEEEEESDKKTWYVIELSAAEYHGLFDRDSVVANWRDSLEIWDGSGWRWVLPLGSQKETPAEKEHPQRETLEGLLTSHRLRLTKRRQKTLRSKIARGEFVSSWQI